jgi:hypothetical protein
MLLGTSIYKPEVFKSELRLSRITYGTGVTREAIQRVTPPSAGAKEAPAEKT